MPSKRSISVRGMQVGGGAPVRIQSMTTTDTRDSAATIDQIRSLVSTGCDIVRVTVPDAKAVEALPAIRSACEAVPLVADIHFNWQLALGAIHAGFDKIRINPGNIGGAKRLAEVVAACKKAGIPLRVGVNAGSLEQQLSATETADKLVESALKNIALVEDCGYDQICVSAKASDVQVAVSAYRQLSKKTPYPLHIGITESGTLRTGTIKSCAGLGALLIDGIGDTIRISLADKPEFEVKVARDLLRFLGFRKTGVEVIACPSCGRTEVDLVRLAQKVEQAVGDINTPLTVAVMGCIVNGPGEAQHADYAVIGGTGSYILMAKGEKVATVPESQALPRLLELIHNHV